jgi:Flp pilus assembly protein TadD
MKRAPSVALLLMVTSVVWGGENVPLPDPDLSALEPAVAEQLAEVRELATTVVHNQLTSAIEKAKAWADMALLFHAYELLDAADVCYGQAEELEPEKPDWIYYRAHVAVANGDLDRAATYFLRVLGMRPGDLATLIHLADLEVQRGRQAEARTLLDLAAAVAPKAPVVRARQGELALAEGRHQEAVDHLTAALAAVPVATRLHYALGLAYRGLGDLDQARHHLALRGDVGLSPADPLLEELGRVQVGERVHLLRGRKAFHAGSFAEAVSEFRLALEAEPESVRARINLSAALAGTGDTAAAAEELIQVVAVAPRNVTARFNLGTLLASAGRHREAIAELEAAVTLRPDDEEAWMSEAKSWVALEDYGQAARRLEEASAAVPGSLRVAFALAKLLAAAPDLAVRDGERALELASRVFELEQKPSHAELVSLALREQGRCDEARQWLEGLISQGEEIDAAEEVASERGCPFRTTGVGRLLVEKQRAAC